jgi:thiosulfate/3-mercaptopyruvate sulfurtransferase
LNSYRTLVDTEALARHLDDPRWRTFDCRHDLAQPALGAKQHLEGHVPGALFLHLDTDLSGPKNGSNGRHPLPDPQVFIALLGRAGLTRGHQVIAYDAGNGTMAARLWWMLNWVGHESAAVLDGGFAKWVKEGREVTRALPEYQPAKYDGVPTAANVDAAYVAAHLGAGDTMLLDARAPARFRGEAEPIDPVAGRIPGARNRFCTENLGTNGLFKRAEDLRREYGVLLGDRTPHEVVHYCGSGVAACHNALSMEIAGFPGSRVYAGSWSEWISDPRRPQEKG